MTARARIRDVALQMLAERGTEGTSLRKVAEQAGVSTGLVQHHFGSRAGLLQACDEYAIGTLLDRAERAADGVADQPDLIRYVTTADPLALRYLCRALVERSPAASRLFNQGAELTERMLSENWPDRFPPDSDRVRNAAAVMSAMHLGTLALHDQIAQRTGVDVLEPANAHLIGAGITDIYRAMAEYLAPSTGSALAESPHPKTARNA